LKRGKINPHLREGYLRPKRKNPSLREGDTQITHTSQEEKPFHEKPTSLRESHGKRKGEADHSVMKWTKRGTAMEKGKKIQKERESTLNETGLCQEKKRNGKLKGQRGS